MLARQLILAMAVLMMAPAALAHGIAGNRYFPGTLTFDDPAVADELVLPNFSTIKHPTEGGNVVDDTLGVAFTRLLTNELAMSIDSSWAQHNRIGFPRQTGLGTTSLTVKRRIFENDPHEALAAASLS
jgi:hypothetical protein